MAANRDPLLQEFAGAERLTVIACHPRAVRWLLARSGAPFDLERVQFLDMRTATAEAILAEVASAPGDTDRPPHRHVPDAADAGTDGFWRPWFPVIDYARCTNCRQCLEFCLFGVYETAADGRVTVTRPNHCKNNCPSCARLCPQMAIMFPKIEEESPVSGTRDDATQAVGKVCLTQEQLFGGNALDKLRARQQRPRLLKNERY